MTIKKGTGSSVGNLLRGGGVYIGPEASCTVQSCVITFNTADYGGGVYADDGTLISIGTVISCNRARNNGGGVYSNSPDVVGANTAIEGQSVVSNNSAQLGGGVYANSNLTNDHKLNRLSQHSKPTRP